MTSTTMHGLVRAGLLAGSLLLVVPGLDAKAAGPGVDPSPSQTDLTAFVSGLWLDAEREGVSREVFDAAFLGLAPDPSIAAMTRRQPEFAKPIGAYLAGQVTPGRVAAGRTMLAKWQTELAAIEGRFGVPGAIVVAVWGLETNYGAAPGAKDVLRSVATLAAMNYRPALYRGEVLAVLAMLQSGQVRREDLRGSWAGAMGQPQFMPSSYLKYAVDGDGDGIRNIWSDVPDALASIASFIQQQGWQPGQPWGFEIALPGNLDPGQSRASFKDWSARGVTRRDGRALPDSGNGTLFFPAGADGPAFLVTANFEVLKTYNFSDAYVLSVGLLADQMTGSRGFVGTWPNAAPMTKDDRIALQARLAARGYDVDNREGRISLALRDVIRQAQAEVGLTPDGNPTVTLLKALVRDGNKPRTPRQ